MDFLNLCFLILSLDLKSIWDMIAVFPGTMRRMLWLLPLLLAMLAAQHHEDRALPSHPIHQNHQISILTWVDFAATLHLPSLGLKKCS